MKQFFDFAKERHRIYLRRHVLKSPAPWTLDPILHHYRFTNVYRELDNVTIWFRENVRDRLRNSDDVMMATVMFRLFNRNKTGEAIFNQQLIGGFTPFELYLDQGMTEDVHDIFFDAIKAYCGKLGPYCTGAYIINSPNGMDKLTGVLRMIGWVHERRQEFLDAIKARGTLEGAWELFRTVDHIADFTSYEFVTDLRHTALLENASDINTWANPGPGAMRGLNRIYGRPLDSKQKKHLFVCEMRAVLEASRDPKNWPSYWSPMEMREVEHTLCEMDKYLRAQNDEGRPRGVYPHGR